MNEFSALKNKKKKKYNISFKKNKKHLNKFLDLNY